MTSVEIRKKFLAYRQYNLRGVDQVERGKQSPLHVYGREFQMPKEWMCALIIINITITVIIAATSASFLCQSFPPHYVLCIDVTSLALSLPLLPDFHFAFICVVFHSFTA